MRIKTTPKRGNDTIATTKDEVKHEVKDEPKDETKDETKEQKEGNEESKPKPKSKKRSRGDAPAVPVACFRRLARAMADDCKSDLRWEASALQALQVATEAFAVEKFQKAGDTSRQFERKTLRALHA
jgi:histone H3/H4